MRRLGVLGLNLPKFRPFTCPKAICAVYNYLSGYILCGATHDGCYRPSRDAPVMRGAFDARARFEEAAMAGKGRASVNDMKRFEVVVLREITRQSMVDGVWYVFSLEARAVR